MLAFPLSTDPKLPWQDVPMVRSVAQALGILQLGFLVKLGGAAVAAAVYFASLAWILLTLGCSVYVGAAFINNKFNVLWPLKFLRGTAKVTSVALFVPLCSMLMQVFACPPGGSLLVLPQTACGSWAHILLALNSIVVLIAFACFSALVLAVFFDRDPRSKSITASAHGRISVFMLLAKLALTLLYTQTFWLPGWLMIAASIITSFLWIGLYWTYLPMYHMWMNYLKVALGAVHLWAGLSAIIGLASSTHLRNTGMPGSVFVAGALLAAALGALMTYRRWAWHEAMASARLSSPYMVELLCRRLLAHADKPEGAVSTLAVDLASMQQGTDMVEEEAEVGYFSDEKLDGKELSKRAFAAVSSILQAAERSFPSSSMMHLFIAQYMRTYRNNRHLELQHLAKAEAHEPAIDEAFIVFQRRRQLEDNDSGDGGLGNVILRVKYEKHKKEASSMKLKARKLQMEFWQQLAAKAPAISQLHKTGLGLAEAVARGDAAYRAMVRIAPRSVQVLRTYAEFLLDITNNPIRAEKYLAHANAIDDEAAGDKGQASHELELMGTSLKLDSSSDTVAVIVASDREANVGMIKSANAAAAALFGYSQRELLTLNVSELIPQPLASIHDKFILRYLETGIERVISTHRTVFGVHRQGHIMPLVQHVRSMQGGFGSLFEAIDCLEKAFIVALGPRLITGADKDTLAALSLDGRRMAMGEHVALMNVLPALASELDKREGKAAASADLGQPKAGVARSLRRATASKASMGLRGTFVVDSVLPSVPLSIARRIVSQFCTDAEKGVLDEVLKHVLTVSDDGPGAAGAHSATCQMKVVVRVQITPYDVSRFLPPLSNGEPRPSNRVAMVAWKPAMPSHIRSMIALKDPSVASSSLSHGHSVDSQGKSTTTGASSDVASGSEGEGETPGVLAGKSMSRQPSQAVIAGLTHQSQGDSDAGSDGGSSEGNSADLGTMGKSVGGSSSSSSTAGAMVRLRALIAATDKTMEPALKRLHWALFMVTAVASAVALIAAILPYIFLDMYTTAVDLAQTCGHLQMYLQSMLELAQIAGESARDMLTFTVYFVPTSTAIRSSEAVFNASGQFLLDAGMRYQAVQQDLMQGLKLNPDMLARFEEGSLQLDVPPSLLGADGTSNRNRTASLLAAGIEMVSAAMTAASTPMREWQNSTAEEFTLLRNGAGIMAPELDDVITQSLQVSDAALSDIQLIQDIVLGAAVACILIVATLSIIPTVLSNEESKNFIFRIFLDVPLSVVRALRLESTRRYKRAAAAILGDETLQEAAPEEDVVVDHSQAKEESALVPVQGQGREQGLVKSASDATQDASAEDLVAGKSDLDSKKGPPPQSQADQAVEHATKHSTRAAGWRMAKLKRRGRVLHKSILSVVKPSAIFLSPFLLMSVYLVLVYFWDRDLVFRVRVLGGGALGSIVRSAAFHRISHCSLEAALKPTPAEVRKYSAFCRDRIESFMELQNGLLYGSDDLLGMSIPPGLSTRPELEELFVVDGCPAGTIPIGVKSDWFFGKNHQGNMTACYLFMNGVLGAGAQAAVLSIQSTALSILTIAELTANASIAAGNTTMPIMHNVEVTDGHMLSDLVEALLTASQGFGAAALSRATTVRQDMIQEEIDAYLTLRTLAGISMAVFLWIVHYALASGVLTRMDEEQKRIRRMRKCACRCNVRHSCTLLSLSPPSQCCSCLRTPFKALASSAA